MEEKEVMDILRYYRHDVLNDLQIVHAYTSMGKLEKVEEKLETYMAHFDEERKLMNLNAPNLALWLIPFNSIHPNFRFTYAIRDERIDISDIDQRLTTDCQYCITRLQEISNDEELYEGEIVLEYLPRTKQIQVLLTLNGSFANSRNVTLPKETKSITQQKGENHVTYTVTIPWNRKGEE